MATYECLSCQTPATGPHTYCPQPRCGAYRSIVRTDPEPDHERAPARRRARPVHASQVARARPRKLSTGVHELDHVLDGGLVPRASVLVYGPPGCGKTTMLARVADTIAQARRGRALYVTAEMPEDAVVMLAQRGGHELRSTWLLHSHAPDEATDTAEDLRPAILVWDSIQALGRHDPAETLRVAARACELGSDLGAVTLIVSQVNRGDDPAGVRGLPHLVDATLEIRHGLLRAEKNRYGAAPREAAWSPA